MLDLQNFSTNQKKAIITNDKHLRIVACAGSGKTTTVAGKIAYLLDPNNGFDLRPENIIAFTYTEKAAGELKNKVLNNIPDSYKGLANMYVGTIHGWCLKSLQNNEYRFQNFSVLDDIKLKLFIDKYYDIIGMKKISKISNKASFLRRFIDTSLFIKIMDIVRESDFDIESTPKNILEAKEQYCNTLKSKHYFDFSMIMEETMKCLDDDTNLAKHIKNNLKYLIVDEYQDVNPLQEKLINRLQQLSGCRLIVVGDDDQNIYQWRGSNNKYIIDFEQKFPDDEVVTIPLSTNFRSSEGIIKLSECLISNNKNRISLKKMQSSGNQAYDRGDDIIYNRYDGIEDENEAIAQYIEDIIGVRFSDGNKEVARGIDYSDIAILLRTWHKAETIVQTLDKYHIPYITAGVNQLFSTSEVQAALGIFSFLYGDIDDSELKKRWLVVPNSKISEQNLDFAISQLRCQMPDNAKVKDNWEYSLQNIYWDFINNAEIYEDRFIDNSSNELKNKSKERAEIIFFNLGKFSQVINDFETINFNSTSPSFHLFSFLSFITYVAKDYYPEGWLNNPYKTPNAVQIMTIHQAKGLEFPCVIIPGLNQNYIPSKKRGGLNEWHFLDRGLIKEQSRYEGDVDKEDERRLLYVALTRSQKYLFLTQAPDLNNKLYKKESQFIAELEKAQIDSIAIMISDKRHKFSDCDKINPTPKERINDITLDFTRLKDLFECPYRFKLVSIFGFCYPLNQRMGVGESFHNCLMEIHKEAKNGKTFNNRELDELIERQTHFPYLTKSTQLNNPLKDKVKNGVLEYYKDNQNDFQNIEFVEQDIQYRLDSNILVVGRIDLIKKIKSTGHYETTIVEFKSDEDLANLHITKDQLKLYALGHKELTGEMANYIMTYIVGKNQPKTPEKLYESDIEEIERKICKSVSLIRNENFSRTCNSVICKENCFHIRLCSNRVSFNIKPKR